METRLPTSGGGAALFDRRARRADDLAAASDTGREALRFAAGLCRAQERLAWILESRLGVGQRVADDLATVLDASSELLRFVIEAGPPLLGDAARAWSAKSRAEAIDWLEVSWGGRQQTLDDYLARALLQPYVALRTRSGLGPLRPPGPGECPSCGGRPWIAVRRSADAAEGTERFLGCALCGGEWRLLRALCPACGADDPERLPSFQSGEHAEARVEACESCHVYVKSIDLTREGRAVPEVDDLASLGLDFWASAEGFARLEPGLAGRCAATPSKAQPRA
jgi:hypothetical protein